VAAEPEWLQQPSVEMQAQQHLECHQELDMAPEVRQLSMGILQLIPLHRDQVSYEVLHLMRIRILGMVDKQLEVDTETVVRVG
jgi:hypothetical protein